MTQTNAKQKSKKRAMAPETERLSDTDYCERVSDWLSAVSVLERVNYLVVKKVSLLALPPSSLYSQRRLK